MAAAYSVDFSGFSGKIVIVEVGYEQGHLGLDDTSKACLLEFGGSGSLLLGTRCGSVV